MKTRLFILFMISFFLLITAVYANIICNDGSVSPSCSTCSRGCCSRHGGCSSRSSGSNSSSSSNLDSSYGGSYNSNNDIINNSEDGSDDNKSSNNTLYWICGIGFILWLFKGDNKRK